MSSANILAFFLVKVTVFHSIDDLAFLKLLRKKIGCSSSTSYHKKEITIWRSTIHANVLLIVETVVTTTFGAHDKHSTNSHPALVCSFFQGRRVTRWVIMMEEDIFEQLSMTFFSNFIKYLDSNYIMRTRNCGVCLLKMRWNQDTWLVINLEKGVLRLVYTELIGNYNCLLGSVCLHCLHLWFLPRRKFLPVQFGSNYIVYHMIW